MSQPSSVRRLLLPLTPLYRLALAARELRLKKGWEPTRSLRSTVVSIGNLSTGGAGKTPFTIALAQALIHRGLRVDVLSRGYGRSSQLPLRVNPEGAAQDFGDEPLLIARLAQVPVYVAARRYEAGLLAEAAAQADCDQHTPLIHLLDDGFQHRQLRRDVDILLINRDDWRSHLLPAGNLREPLCAIRRATVLAIPANEPELEIELRAWGWQGPVWRLIRNMEVPPVDGPALAFCGIARPAQFFQGLESAGLQLASRIVFADHHRYTAGDLGRIQSVARSTGATVLITTEKDLVRIGDLAAALPQSLPLHTACLRIKIEDESAALNWLGERLAQPHGSSF